MLECVSNAPVAIVIDPMVRVCDQFSYPNPFTFNAFNHSFTELNYSIVSTYQCAEDEKS